MLVVHEEVADCWCCEEACKGQDIGEGVNVFME